MYKSTSTTTGGPLCWFLWRQVRLSSSPSASTLPATPEAGIIPAKPGRRYASRLLQSPLGLVLRLEKTVVTCWAVGMFVMGASYGSVFGDVETFAQTSDLYKQILPSVEGFSLTDQFLAMLLAILSMIAAVPALQIILRLRVKKRANRVEHLLAGAVSRNHLMAAFLVVAVAAAAVMQP